MDTPLPFGKPPAVSAFLSEHTKTTTSVETISAHFADETNWDQSKTPSLTPKTPLRKLREIVKKEWEMSSPGGVPYRGIAPAPETPTAPPSTPQPDSDVASPATLRERLGRLKTGIGKSLGNFMFAPRASDWVQMIHKLEDQFTCLEAAHERYLLERDASSWGEDIYARKSDSRQKSKDEYRSDPKHPINTDRDLTNEVHFVGRHAIDPSVLQLTSLLIDRDSFGTITEIWLNDNHIGDRGAESISSFLELKHCPLVELWLGKNRIGPEGCTLISAALCNNADDSKLKCLGLYLNPIGNGGASTLAQMLRKNHTITTLDVHGCIYEEKNGVGKEGGRSHEVVEHYGCHRFFDPNDGKEYIARVVESNSVERAGFVTDERFLDAIKTFTAFNRINPTREQAIRGMMGSNKQEISNGEGENCEPSNASKFLSDLCQKPADERLTQEEKCSWKEVEWTGLYMAIEKVRKAKEALANQIEVKNDLAFEVVDEREGDQNDDDEEDSFQFDSLDDEIIKTSSRTWRDLKVEIAGHADTHIKSKFRFESGADTRQGYGENQSEEEGMFTIDDEVPPAPPTF